VPELLLDFSTPQGSELHLDVSTSQGSQLHLEVSTLQRPVLHLGVSEQYCRSLSCTYTTEAFVLLKYWYKIY
jgi:hypothetical protein